MTRVLPTRNADNRSALRQLCEIIYQPTEARRDAVMAENWSKLPRVEKALATLDSPITPTALSAVARQLIESAVEELEPRFPTSADAVTQIEVVRWHILDRQPWPSIEAMLLEQSRPHSRGTLIRRQHEFLPYLEEWAANGTGVGSGRRSRLTRALPFLAGLAILIALIGMQKIRGAPDTPPAWKDLRSYSGVYSLLYRLDQWPDIQRSFEIEPKPVPEVGFEPRSIQILPRNGGRGPLGVLTATRSGTMPGGLALFDILSGKLLWETSFVPPRDEIMTHSTLSDVVLDDPFQGTLAILDPGDADRIVVPFTNKFSPCFVVQFDIETGEVISYYVHPGRLETGLAIDIDGDGASEFVFGGQDNVYNRAVIVALEATDTNGAASTVMWRKDDPGEDALVRTLFPPILALQDSTSVPRLTIEYMSPENWVGSTGTLCVEVIANARNPAYTAFLDARMTPTKIFLGDSATKTWERCGVDAGMAEGLMDGVIVVRGSGK